MISNIAIQRSGALLKSSRGLTIINHYSNSVNQIRKFSLFNKQHHNILLKATNLALSSTTNLASKRGYAVESPRGATSVGGGGMSWKALFITLSIVGGGYLYFKEEKKRVMEEKHYREKTGRPDIGGPFSMKDIEGNEVNGKDLLGHWTMLYFGFTYCPDICPEEMEKLTKILNNLDNNPITKDKVQPIFVSVDPQRDSVPVVKEYLKDFHPKFRGFTGTDEEVKNMARQFRVHYSKGPPISDANDYIVDHSIITYLLDPKGHYHAFFLINHSSEYVTDEIVKHIKYNLDIV